MDLGSLLHFMYLLCTKNIASNFRIKTCWTKF